MKIVVIGDIHGRDVWKEIVEKEHDANKFVFVGDYFDSWDVTPLEQIKNFTHISVFKEMHPYKCILLIGNHDFQYLTDNQRYSGYNDDNAATYRRLLNGLIEQGKMQVLHKDGNFLFSHAGVSKEWIDLHSIDYGDFVGSVNKMFVDGKYDILDFFQPDVSRCGDDVHQSPIWIRPNSFEKSAIDGYTQIVGHTQMETISEASSNGNTLVFVDTLETGYYLVIDDGVMSIKSV